MTQIGLIILGRESELTIVDTRERVVTINKPVNRVVVAAPEGVLETLRALKADEKVVGVCHYIPQQEVFFPELSKVTDFGGYPPDYETILGLNPDLVIAYAGTCEQADITIETCQDAGITVVCFCSFEKETEREIDEITKLGYIFGKKEEAEKFIDFIQDIQAETSEMVEDIPEEDKPKVYIETSFYESAAIKTSPPGLLCELAGGINIGADLTPSSGTCGPIVTTEWVIREDPDVIIKMAHTSICPSGYETDDTSAMKALRDEIMNRPGLAEVKAVKNGQVYVMSCRLVVSAGRYVGIPYMAKMFQPELFSDLDPKEFHQQYVTEFQGLDFDVYEHGVFVYHPVYFPEG